MVLNQFSIEPQQFVESLSVGMGQDKFSVETTDINDEYLDETIEIQQSAKFNSNSSEQQRFGADKWQRNPLCYWKESSVDFSTVYYIISLRAILFEDAGHKDEENEQTSLQK